MALWLALALLAAPPPEADPETTIMNVIRATPPGLIEEDWARHVLNYLEALKGRGPLPNGPDHFILRLRSKRQDARITPGQFRQSLGYCRQTDQRISPSHGLVVEWACAGRGALGRHLVLQISGYGDRIAGVVWVDRRPPPTI
ncbi:hypothetical protein [Allosphingosinicella sp.]|uniref:hypothetical protein n=1 Tax=Allosphingosinicella sp. TaxID=2823234 RepID=UPI003784AC09